MSDLNAGMAGNAVSPTTEEKHQALMGVYYQINDIMNRLDNLNERLGVYSDQTQSDDTQKADSKDPENLVQVLERMPIMASNKINEIYDLISQLESRLI